MVVRGRPIARARSVQCTLRGAGASRPSATQRVPECVCVNLREYASLTLARIMLHRYEVQHVLGYSSNQKLEFSSPSPSPSPS